MPNYLQRVALSGARTGPPALPAVLPPPRLPSIAAAGPAARDTAAPADLEPRPPAAVQATDPWRHREQESDRQEAARPLKVQIETPATPPVIARASSATLPRLPDPPLPGPARPAASTAISAPKSLRLEPAPGHVVSSEAPRRPPLVRVLHAPRALRPPAPPDARQVVSESTGVFPEQPKVLDNAPASVEPAADPSSDNPAIVLVPEPPVTDTRTNPNRAAKPHHEPPPAAGPAERPIDPASAPGLLPREPLGRPDVYTQGTRANRDTRIAIGRVEVQVNNHPASAPAPEKSLVRGGVASLHRLEVHYLNRFSFRP